MHNIRKFAAVITTLTLTVGALRAKTVEQSYIELHRGRTDIPVPVEVVMPQARIYALDDVVDVELTFVVDPTGKPVDIRILSSTDQTVAAVAREAVSKWRFEPVRRNGEPVASKVVLPVRFVVDHAPPTR